MFEDLTIKIKRTLVPNLFTSLWGDIQVMKRQFIDVPEPGDNRTRPDWWYHHREHRCICAFELWIRTKYQAIKYRAISAIQKRSQTHTQLWRASTISVSKTPTQLQQKSNRQSANARHTDNMLSYKLLRFTSTIFDSNKNTQTPPKSNRQYTNI